MHSVRFDTEALVLKDRPGRPRFHKQELPWAVYLDTVLHQSPHKPTEQLFIHYDFQQGYYTYVDTPDTYTQALSLIDNMETSFDKIDPTFLHKIPLDHTGMSKENIIKRERTRYNTRVLVQGMMWYKTTLQSKVNN